MYFQFHKGTIKTLCKHSDIYDGVSFQFHKGTIKTAYFGDMYERVKPFQFHKGTIKTDEICVMDAEVIRFQFHKGTIKTYSEFSEFARLTNFNSIKVQLRLRKREDLQPEGP